MKSYEVMRVLRRRAGAKMMAAAVALSKGYTDKWCRPVGAGETGELNPLDRVVQMLRLPGGLELVQWLCEQAGGFFVRQVALTVWRKLTLAKAAGVVLGCTLRYAGLVYQAEQSKNVSPELAAKLEAAWQELLTEAGGFMAAIRQGAFRLVALFYLLQGGFLSGELPELALVAEG